MEVAKKTHSDESGHSLNRVANLSDRHTICRPMMVKVFSYFKVIGARGEVLELDGLRAIATLVLGRHRVQPFYSAQDGLFSVGSAWDFATPLLNGWK